MKILYSKIAIIGLEYVDTASEIGPLSEKLIRQFSG